MAYQRGSCESMPISSPSHCVPSTIVVCESPSCHGVEVFYDNTHSQMQSPENSRTGPEADIPDPSSRQGTGTFRLPEGYGRST